MRLAAGVVEMRLGVDREGELSGNVSCNEYESEREGGKSESESEQGGRSGRGREGVAG